MGRLVDVPPDPPEEITVQVGDFLRFSGSGGIRTRGDSVEVIGVLNDAVVGLDGTVITPEGPPTSVLLHATGTGRTDIEIITNVAPFAEPTRTLVRVTVLT